MGPPEKGMRILKIAPYPVKADSGLFWGEYRGAIRGPKSPKSAVYGQAHTDVRERITQGFQPRQL